jgi:hypothetical protein
VFQVPYLLSAAVLFTAIYLVLVILLALSTGLGDIYGVAWMPVAAAVVTLTTPYRMELTETSLRVLAVLRKREALLTDIVAIGPGGIRSGWVVFRLRSRRRQLLLFAGKGLRGFLADVATAAPDITTERSPRWDRIEGSRGRSGYRRLS